MRSPKRQHIRRRLRTPVGSRGSNRPRTNARRRHGDPTGRNEDLTSALSHCHRLVLSGVSLDSAITSTAFAHRSPEIRSVYAHMADGESLEFACRKRIQELTSRNRSTHRDRDALIALHVLSFSGAEGGRVAEHLEALLITLNDRHRLREERNAQAAQAAMSMDLLTWLPLVCGAWMIADSASVRSFLFGSVLGWTCLMLGIGLNLCGRWWLRREVSAC